MCELTEWNPTEEECETWIAEFGCESTYGDFCPDGVAVQQEALLKDGCHQFCSSDGLGARRARSAGQEPRRSLLEAGSIALPMSLTNPGSIRIACPKGMLGTMVLSCEGSAADPGVPEVRVTADDCEEIHDDVCHSFGAACGMCGKDKPPGGKAGYCGQVKRQGLCAKPKYFDQCQETCCFE
jgi:hypothetical protein